MTNEQKLQLRLNIYFSLTNRQQRKFNTKNSWHFIEQISASEFQKITKNKVLLEKLIMLKRASIRLVA